MGNFYIWRCVQDSDLLVQVFNKSYLPEIQEKFIKEGYFVKETFIGKDGKYFFVIGRLEDV